jgi:hypothetical protein
MIKVINFSSHTENAYLVGMGEVSITPATECSLTSGGEGASVEAPVVPTTERELRAFAKVYGWTVKVKAGTFILVTDI